jgi:hypothetical protein
MSDQEISQYVKEMLTSKQEDNPNNRAIGLENASRGIGRIEASEVSPSKVSRASLPNNSAATFRVALTNGNGKFVAYANIYDDCWLTWN